MDESTEWSLIANASDKTNLRNKLIYDFANHISPHQGWVPENKYVDLFINGEYAGLYLLCEKKENAAYKFKEKKDEYITICLNNHFTKLDNPETAVRIDDSDDGIYAEIVAPSSVTSLVKRLNTQRNVSVDYALVEDADHMYNNHLVDLYKIAGHYIIDAMKKKAPTRKRRGRRKKSELENDEPLMLENDTYDSHDETTVDDFDDED
jgi:hypothetical protein